MRRDKYTGSVATPNAKVVGAVATEKLAVWEVGSGVRMNGGIVGGGMLTGVDCGKKYSRDYQQTYILYYPTKNK